MNKVYVLRGIPGSGKSHWVSQYRIQKYATVCSADHYFVKKDGSYEFDPKKLPRAHYECFENYLNVLQENQNNWWQVPSDVIIDNTNLSLWEISPYVKLAEVYGHDVEIVEFNTPFDVCLARQTHGVPENKLLAMQLKFRNVEIPRFWNVKTTVIQHKK